MAGRRPKPIDNTLGHRTKAEKESRKEVENKLKSSDNQINRTPSHLSAEAKKVYKWLVEQFKETGILCNLDKETIAICADAISKMRQAQFIIEEKGLIIEGNKNGITTLIENPAIRIYEKYEKIYARMITELGLSPSARSKMALTQSQAKEKEEDPLLRILRGEDIDDDVI